MSVILKNFIVCAEYINSKYFYTIRDKNDCCSSRFKIIADFDTFKEADKYIKLLEKI